MAKNSQTGNEKATAQKKTAQKFTVGKLQANCRELFRCSTSTFAGATHGMTGKYTIGEMKNIIEEWKKKGVK